MYDVFISYSTRGATSTEWLIKFIEELGKYYQLNNSRKLRIWCAVKENIVGDNFEVKVFEAIEQSLVFLMILDPAYIESPETLKEVAKYESVREGANEPKNYISLIKWRGNKEPELKSFTDSNLIVSYFSYYNSDNNEEEYDDKSNKYKNEIQNIVKAIRKRELEETRKRNTQKILNRLALLTDVPKIYVAFGNTIWKNSRSQLINQLTKTLERTDNLKNIKVLPDCLTGVFQENDLQNEDLADLLYDENSYGKSTLNAMLDVSSFVVVPFLSDKTNEAELLLNKIRFQLNAIRAKSIENKLPVTILADIPKELYELEDYSDVLDNAQYDNIKVIKEVDIGRFIESCMVDLNFVTGSPKALPDKKEKRIYIVEHYDPANEYNEQLTDEKEVKQLELEIQNRRNLRKHIADKNFVLVKGIESNASFSETIEYHKRSLSISDAIIIYKGPHEDSSWCIRQQADTYGVILDLSNEKRENIAKAVYIDPLQKERNKEDYIYYNYDVILDFPKELDDFLCKIQQH